MKITKPDTLVILIFIVGSLLCFAIAWIFDISFMYTVGIVNLFWMPFYYFWQKRKKENKENI